MWYNLSNIFHDNNFYVTYIHLNNQLRTSLVAQWLRLCFHCRGCWLNLGLETKSPYATGCHAHTKNSSGKVVLWDKLISKLLIQ